MIRSIYTDPRNPAGLSSIDKLYTAAKRIDPNVTRDTVKDELQGEFVYTLHHPARRYWERNKIIVSRPHIQAQADLCDMASFASVNDGYKYILTFVDCFSRFALARAVRSKKQHEIAAALESILTEYPVEKLQTDRGLEFKNKVCQKAVAMKGTFLFFTVNQDIKCAIVERFNRTLKSRMYKYFTLKGTRNWITVLDDLLYAYNHSVNRAIKKAPVDVTSENSEEVFKLLYDGMPDEMSLFNEMLSKPVESEKFKVGDMVKLRHYLSPMEHRYLPNFSDQYYLIDRIVRGYPHARFKLILWEDKSPLDGSYYAEELQHVKHGEYRISVKDREKRGRREYLLVHFVGYPSKFDAWMPANEVRSLGQ